MTATTERLAARIDELPEGSLRRRTLEGARRFKASWVEMARLLAEVRDGEHWREWGHPSYPAYCARELFIRRQTAEKLAASFGFLERHEPELARGEGRGAPPFEVVEILSRAEAQGRLPAGAWRELRDEVLERPPLPGALSRQIAERWGPEERPRPPPGERLARLAAAARRLADACADEKRVPRSVAERARALAEALGALAEG
ncbi:MAG TPA: hypothetical protein VH880_11160 [Anaeromyxobacteraceae bacterium]